MPTVTVQVVILAAAYVLVVVGGLAALLFAAYNFRFLRSLDSQLTRMEGKKDLSIRLGRVEDSLTSQRDLVDSLSKRLNRREGMATSRRRSSEPDESSEPSEPQTHEEVLARIQSGKRVV